MSPFLDRLKLSWRVLWMPIPPVQKFQPGDIPVTNATAAAYQLGYANGVQMGIAQGELKGRTELAIELEAQYGVDAREDLTTEAVKRIRARQVH